MHTSVAKHERAVPAVPRNLSTSSKSSRRELFPRTKAQDREKTKPVVPRFPKSGMAEMNSEEQRSLSF